MSPSLGSIHSYHFPLVHNTIHKRQVEFGNSKYYALYCHTAVTPLNLVKCRLQVDKERYKNLSIMERNQDRDTNNNKVRKAICCVKIDFIFYSK